MPGGISVDRSGAGPARLLPFDDALGIDGPAFRTHLRDLAGTEVLSAVTIDRHSIEVATTDGSSA